MSNDLILEIKPKFVFSLRYIYAVFKSLLWIYIPLYVDLIIPAIMNDEPIGWCIYIVVHVIMLIIAVKIILLLDEKRFAMATYRVYSDKIEFEEGLTYRRCGYIKARAIKEITCSQNTFQLYAGVGTISFVALLSQNKYVLQFKDIENYELIYAKIKEICEKN